MKRSITILVADDSDDDVLFLRRAFEKAKANAVLRHVTDGVTAIDYLAGRGLYGERKNYPFPQLMILDIKMPRKDGFDVLEWVRGEGNLRSLPIIMWSSCGQQREVDRAFELGVNSYLVKPAGLAELDVMVRALRDFWLLSSILPSVALTEVKGIAESISVSSR
jgi:DNA-binding response OmpR family regulator